MSKEEAETASIPTAQSQTPKVGKKEKLVTDLIRQLTEASTQLVLKVAICNCNHKSECDVFKKAQEIATIIDKLQGVRGKV